MASHTTKAATRYIPFLHDHSSFERHAPIAWTRTDEQGRLVGLYTPEQARKYWGGAQWTRSMMASLGLTPIFEE